MKTFFAQTRLMFQTNERLWQMQYRRYPALMPDYHKYIKKEDKHNII